MGANNIKEIPINPDAMKGILLSIRRDMDNQIELIAIKAELTKKKYDTLISSGFTEAQAIELCKESIF